MRPATNSWHGGQGSEIDPGTANGLEDSPDTGLRWIGKRPALWGFLLLPSTNTISIAFGSAYVNDFVRGGRVKHVDIQADAPTACCR